MSVDIVIDEKYLERLKLRDGWVLITGFPGFGYVGTIATRYIVTQLGAEKVGNVITKYMPDFIALDDYGVLTPYEVFTSYDHGLIILVNNATPPSVERVAFAKAVTRWAKSLGVREFILVGGLNSKFREGGERLRWLKTSVSGRELPEPKFHKGLYVVGPLAILFMTLEVEKVPAVMILPYTEPDKFDPKAAAVFIEKMNELLNLNVSIQGLMEYSRAVEEAEALLSETLRNAKEEDKRPKPYI
ncbi:MAG: PAC2 family protein [Sulfolobales archaeon]|nr:PAC2 family protein [Sulfolobales archaeon]MCX8185672.1 PAC2 family protein [Sulfolobales archaeon]MDW7969615.1 PAC2 family protein [Sulfolobales archaeon]